MSELTARDSTAADRSPRRLSTVIEQLSETASDPITVEQIRDALGDRSFAAMLAVFACVNLLPLPPGTTLILGLPLVIVSMQMVLGHSEVWLPRFLLNKSVAASRFREQANRHLPRIQKLERLIRPRYWPFFAQRGVDDRIIGLISLILAIMVTVPIPLSNWLPALAILLIALALSERDGILFGIGSFIGGLSILVVTAVVGAAGALAHILFA